MTEFKNLPLRERARRSPIAIGIAAVVLVVILIKLFSGEVRSQTEAAVLHVCVEHAAKYQDDFDKAFSEGAIDLPSGTVFEASRPAFGPASDPRDIEHSKTPTGWIGISDEEELRRDTLLDQTLKADPKRNAGLVTTSAARLSRSQPCTDVPVAAARSSEWGWTMSPVAGSKDVYFQAVGIDSGGQYDTPENNRSALDNAMIEGKLNGILEGVTQISIDVPNN